MAVASGKNDRAEGAAGAPVAIGGPSPTPSLPVQPMRLITKAELRAIVPYTPQHILRLEKRGQFPRRIQVGPNRVAWLLAEIEAWVSARVSERDRIERQLEKRET